MEKSKRWSFRAHQKRLRIDGFDFRPLISQCMKEGIRIKDLHHISDTEIRLSITEQDYKKIVKVAGNKYRITILNEKGYLHILDTVKTAKWTIVGIALFTLVIYYQTLFISQIVITGYESYSEEEIRRCLQNADFTEGERKPNTVEEIEEVKNAVYSNMNNISWIGIKYDGTKALVTVAESEFIEKTVTETYPADIVADKEGYVAEILPKTGLRAVEDGTFVKPGDILIAGTIPLKSTAYGTASVDITETYVHASGIVKVYVPHHITFKIRKDMVVSDDDKHVVAVTTKGDKDDYETVKKTADRQIRKFMKENYSKSLQISNKSLYFTVKENIINVSVIFDTLEEIGVEKKIEILQPKLSENEENTEDTNRR